MMLRFFHVVLLSIAFQSVAHALDEKEKMEMVEAHNSYRADVDVSEVAWSEKLATIAQNYANKLKNERSCKLVHSHTKGLGENLYWASAITYSSGEIEVQKITSKRVAASWASEQENYNYDNNSCARGKVCGHYTQMVWSDTTEIGCAKAVCENGSQVWVCNYSPPGNYVGEKPY